MIGLPNAAAIEAHVDAAALLLGLQITAEQRPGVLRYFALAATMAAELEGLALAVDAEPAAVFVPVSPLR